MGTEPFAEETKRFWRAVAGAFAPSLWAAEFGNVVWMAVRAGVLPDDEGFRRLHFAGRLRIRSVPIRSVWQGALARAVKADISVYDTLFVEVAARRRLPLATFDDKLLKAFPDVAHRPAPLLGD